MRYEDQKLEGSDLRPVRRELDAVPEIGGTFRVDISSYERGRWSRRPGEALALPAARSRA